MRQFNVYEWVCVALIVFAFFVNELFIWRFGFDSWWTAFHWPLNLLLLASIAVVALVQFYKTRKTT